MDILNFREKGGYLLCKVPCKIIQQSNKSKHSEDENDNNLEENNNNDDNTTIKVLLYIAVEGNHDFFGFDTLDNIATCIAQAVGPSGPNKDYLFNLADALVKFGKVSDDDTNHTIELRNRVKKLLE